MEENPNKLVIQIKQSVETYQIKLTRLLREGLTNENRHEIKLKCSQYLSRVLMSDRQTGTMKTSIDRK